MSPLQNYEKVLQKSVEHTIARELMIYLHLLKCSSLSYRPIFQFLQRTEFRDLLIGLRLKLKDVYRSCGEG
jgi:hypothetical protein